MALSDDLSTLEINEIERRIVAAEKLHVAVTLDAKLARRLLALAVAKLESQERKRWY